MCNISKFNICKFYHLIFAFLFECVEFFRLVSVRLCPCLAAPFRTDRFIDRKNPCRMAGPSKVLYMPRITQLLFASLRNQLIGTTRQTFKFLGGGDQTM